MKNKTLESFEEKLSYTINRYVEGECELGAVLSAANRVMCVKANVGINTKRLPHNEREQAFHDQWQEENAPQPGINNGHGILQDLFINRGEGLRSFDYEVMEEMSKRDRMIVATVIQWLGSNCGMAFLSDALKRFGAHIVIK